VITSDRCPACASRRANRPHWTREQALRAIHAWVREEGSVPTAEEWTPTADATRKWGREYPRWPSNVNVRTLFGTWKRGIEASGFRTRRKTWNRQTIVSSLRQFATAKGRAPTYAELERCEELPWPGTVRANFGSLKSACDAAGLPAHRRRWDRDRIVRALLDYEEEHGHLPTSRDW